jgi:hypothetical protein
MVTAEKAAIDKKTPDTHNSSFCFTPKHIKSSSTSNQVNVTSIPLADSNLQYNT